MAEDDNNKPEPHSHSHESDGGNGNFLMKRVGPLPVVGWVIVIIGAFILYRYISDRNSSSSTMPDSTDTEPSDAGGGDGSTGTTTPTTTTTGTGLTEGQWMSDAEARLKQLGYSQSLIQTAFQRYESGETLDAKEEAVIEAAINLIGQPPNGLQPKLAAPTTSTPKPSPPKKKTPIQVKGTLPPSGHGGPVVIEPDENTNPITGPVKDVTTGTTKEKNTPVTAKPVKEAPQEVKAIKVEDDDATTHAA